MRILFVDDIEHQYEIDTINAITVNTKQAALDIISNKGCDLVFVNVKFNHDFVYRIRKISPVIPVFLMNDKEDAQGLDEYAGLIDGYYRKPIFDQLVRIIKKPIYQR